MLVYLPCPACPSLPSPIETQTNNTARPSIPFLAYRTMSWQTGLLILPYPALTGLLALPYSSCLTGLIGLACLSVLPALSGACLL